MKKYKVVFSLSYFTKAKDEEDAEDICRELLKEDLQESHREGMESIFGTYVEEEEDNGKKNKH
jgi:hypothetical protein